MVSQLAFLTTYISLYQAVRAQYVTLRKNLSKVLGCIERLEKETYLLLLGIAQICRHA